jgi:DNA-binding GntR family transcriptional regulator
MTADPLPGSPPGFASPEAIVGHGRHAAKLARSLYSGRIAAYLREAIIAGELPVHTALVESRLAESLSVSRGPVRSALTVLEGEGLVHTRPNGRVESMGFTGDDLADLFRVRYELESTGMRWGLAAGASLEPVQDAMRAIEAEGVASKRLVEMDIDFHRALLEFSGSRFLVQSWLALAPVIQAVITIGNRRLVDQEPASHFTRIVESHRGVVDALVARDGARATELLGSQFALTQSMFSPTPSARKDA